MRNIGFDFWGVVDTREHAYHIQSWFLAFNRKARQTLLRNFIDKFRVAPHFPKGGQIQEYELWLTQEALSLSLSVGAYCSGDDIREDLIRAPTHTIADHLKSPQHANPSIHGWALLIETYNNPALKVQVLRENPCQVNDLDRWRDIVDPALAPLIANHLERLSRKTSRKPRSRLASAASASGKPTGLELLDRVQGTGLGGGDKIVLLAHYDPHDLLDPHVVKMIDGLKSAGADVVLISGSLDQSSISVAKSHASEILIKTNTARDFGSWYLGLKHLRGELDRYQSVVWMNDSIYYPLFDPKEMFEAMAGTDFWGPVDSYNIRWHVMSWFWSFSRSTIESGIMDWYIDEYSPAYSKWDQVKNYEMRIPLMLREQGFKSRAFISADALMKSERVRTHPRYTGENHFTMTHDFWEILIEDYRCPALKVELVRDNPLNIPLGTNLRRVVDVIERHTGYDPQLILDHIARIKP